MTEIRIRYLSDKCVPATPACSVRVDGAPPPTKGEVRTKPFCLSCVTPHLNTTTLVDPSAYVLVPVDTQLVQRSRRRPGKIIIVGAVLDPSCRIGRECSLLCCRVRMSLALGSFVCIVSKQKLSFRWFEFLVASTQEGRCTVRAQRE